MIKATCIRNYVKTETGNDVFVHSVTFDSQEEHEAFKAAQGNKYRVDQKTGEILWFSSRYHGETVKLLISASNKVIADTSAFAKAKSLAKQYGGDFGQELAKASAQALVVGITKASAPATAEPQATQLPD